MDVASALLAPLSGAGKLYVLYVSAQILRNSTGDDKNWKHE